MKYIKTYESLNNEPEIGDYVLCTDLFNSGDKLVNFIETNIGQFVRYSKDEDIEHKYAKNYPYMIQYNIPDYFFSDDEIHDYFTPINDNDIKLCRIMKRNEILYFSPDKKNVEDKLENAYPQIIKNVRKYNL